MDRGGTYLAYLFGNIEGVCDEGGDFVSDFI